MAWQERLHVFARSWRPPHRAPGERMSVLPMHGKGKELGTGLVKEIKKQLGLD